MKLDTLTGTIERRLLINYRVDPAVAADILPAPFKPALVGGYAIAGICLIQLSVRPTWLPKQASFRSLNGAHRIAVTLPDRSDAVYIPRRDTNSRLNTLVGGRLFPGTHHLATVTVKDSGDRLGMELTSRDGSTHVGVTASTADRLPEASVFDSVRHVSDFFEHGSLGYSDTPGGGCYDGLELRANNWSVTPLAVENVESTFFEDPTLFPAGAAVLDNALLMRDIHHTWHTRAPLDAPAASPRNRKSRSSGPSSWPAPTRVCSTSVVSR